MKNACVFVGLCQDFCTDAYHIKSVRSWNYWWIHLARLSFLLVKWGGFSFGIRFPVISDRGSLCGAVVQRSKLAVCVCQGKRRVAVLLWPSNKWQGLLLKFTFNVLLKITPITLFTQEVLCSGPARWPRGQRCLPQRDCWLACVDPLNTHEDGKRTNSRKLFPDLHTCAIANCSPVSCSRTHLEISNKLRLNWKFLINYFSIF